MYENPGEATVPPTPDADAHGHNFICHIRASEHIWKNFVRLPIKYSDKFYSPLLHDAYCINLKTWADIIRQIWNASDRCTHLSFCTASTIYMLEEKTLDWIFIN